MAPAKIFLAVKYEPLPVIEAALTGYDLLVAKDFDHGMTLLKTDGIDLFVIGILFDDSRAMELIKVLRTQTQLQSIPIIVVRFMPSIHADMLRSVMDTMQATGTISSYLEGELSDNNLAQNIRKLVEDYLPARLLVREQSAL